MTIIKIESIGSDHKEAIFRLWNNEYPERLKFASNADLDLYLNDLTKQLHYFATNAQNVITGWAFTFEREEETWFAIIIDSSDQKQGLGKKFIDLLKTENTQLNGWVIDHSRDLKVNGNPYLSPLPFYLKNNFETCPEVRLQTEKLSAIKIKWPV